MGQRGWKHLSTVQKVDQQANFGGRSRKGPGWAKNHSQAPKWNLRHLPGLSFASKSSWHDPWANSSFSGSLVRAIRHFLHNLQDRCNSPTLFECGWSKCFWCLSRMVLPRLQDLSRLRNHELRRPEFLFGPVKNTACSGASSYENQSSPRVRQRSRFASQLNQPHAVEQYFSDWSHSQRARHA